MAFRFAVGDRVVVSFGIRGEITRFGTVTRLERGAPVVRFDGDGEDRPMRKASCYLITAEHVRMLAARRPSELNAYQRETLAHNRALLEGSTRP